MIPRELLKKIRLIELRTNRLVEETLGRKPGPCRTAAEPLVGGDHDRLPHRAFVRLPVSDQGKDPAVGSRQLQAHRHAGGDADAVAERAGGDFDARNLGPVGVAAEAAARSPAAQT